ncbi:MAG: peptidylprolyl isomerase [bacterium]
MAKKKIEKDKQEVISKVPTENKSGLKKIAAKNIIPSYQKVKAKLTQKPVIKYLKITGLAILSVLVLFIIGVGVTIYGFDSKADFVKRVSQYIPYPATFVGTSSVSFYEYLDATYHAEYYYDRTEVEPVEDYEEKIMDSLINRRIIEAQAKKYRIKVSNDEVDTQLEQEMEQFGGKEKAEEVLLDLYDYKLKDIKELIYVKMLEDRLREKVPVKIHAVHILIQLDENADDKKVKEAQAKADDLYAKIGKGEDFAELAKEHSEDTTTKDQGGDLGFFEKGQFVEEFEKTAFDLKEGEVAKPVRTKYGFHIIKVEERKGEIEKSFDNWFVDIKDKIRTIRLIEL